MSTSILLGVIADDPVKAAELALMLARHGLRTVRVIGIPAEGMDFGDADAVVVALQMRAVAADQAVAMALASALVLRAAGAEQLQFACSPVFDPSACGHVGPVAEALRELLGAPISVVCPAAPQAGVRIFQGHVFAGSRLINENAGDAEAPANDANLVRLLQAQASGRVGLLPHDIVSAGAEAINAVLHKAQQAGFRLMVADATGEADLRLLGLALASAGLVTGSIGLTGALVRNYREQGRIGAPVSAQKMAAPAGLPIILAGACSDATRDQIDTAIAAGMPALKIVPEDIAAGTQVVADVANWVLGNSARGKPALIYSSDAPAAVLETQDRFGRTESGLLVEHMLANLAVILRDNGFSRFLIAGDDSAEAVLAALEVRAVRIGPENEPGVPWMRSIAGPDLALCLKSGPAGGSDFFQSAWAMLED